MIALLQYLLKSEHASEFRRRSSEADHLRRHNTLKFTSMQPRQHSLSLKDTHRTELIFIPDQLRAYIKMLGYSSKIMAEAETISERHAPRGAYLFGKGRSTPRQNDLTVSDV